MFIIFSDLYSFRFVYDSLLNPNILFNESWLWLKNNKSKFSPLILVNEDFPVIGFISNSISKPNSYIFLFISHDNVDDV